MLQKSFVFLSRINGQ